MKTNKVIKILEHDLFKAGRKEALKELEEWSNTLDIILTKFTLEAKLKEMMEK